MDRAEIVKITNEALAKEFELNEAIMVPTAEFVKDLGLDSLDMVDMVVVLEQAFKVKVRTNYEAGKVRTLGDLYDLIEELVRQNS